MPQWHMIMNISLSLAKPIEKYCAIIGISRHRKKNRNGAETYTIIICHLIILASSKWGHHAFFQLRLLIDHIQRKLMCVFPQQRTMYFCKYAKSKEKVLFYPCSSLFLEYKLKIQSIGVSNGLSCILFLTVSSHLKSHSPEYEIGPNTAGRRFAQCSLTLIKNKS